jgi:hypothetical protein
MSRPKCQKIWHFVSYPAELHPIRLGQQRQREFGPEQRRQCRDRKSVGKPVPAGDRFAQTKRIELSRRLSQQAAACGFNIRSRRLALAIWMQARSKIRSRPPCGAAAHTASSTS